MMKGDKKIPRGSLAVSGMMCATNCAVKVLAAAQSVEGVKTAEVKFDQGLLLVEYREDAEVKEVHRGVALAVKSAGYEVESGEEKQLLYLKVEGMTCDHCVKTVKGALASVPGVIHVAVSLNQHIAAVLPSEGVSTSKGFNLKLIDAIESVGFGAEEFAGKSRDVTINVKKSIPPLEQIGEDNKSTTRPLSSPTSTATTDEVLNSFRSISGVACVQVKDSKEDGCSIGSLQYVIRGTATFDDIVTVARQAGLSINMDSFAVSGMMCVTNCAAKVKHAALTVEGVHAAEVDFENEVLHVIYTDSDISNKIHDGVAVAVHAVGYDVEWAGKNDLLYVKIDGMMCGHCVSTVRKALLSLDGVRHVAVNLDQSIAAIATETDLSTTILDTVESVGFGAEVYRGSRDMTIQVRAIMGASDTKSKKGGYAELLNDDIDNFVEDSDINVESDILNPLRSLKGIACVQLKEGQSIGGTGTATHPLELTVRGTITYEELALSSKCSGWEITLVSVSYDSQHQNNQSRSYEKEERQPPDALRNYISMKRGAALLMEGVNNISDIMKPNSEFDSLSNSTYCEQNPISSVFTVKGMSCGACVAAVERVLRKHSCVTKVAVALLTEKAEVHYDSAVLSADEIIADINNAGYVASLVSTSSKDASTKRRLLVSACELTSTKKMQSELSSVVNKIEAISGVEHVAWLQGEDLQLALQDGQNHLNTSGIDSDRICIDNGAMVLDVLFDSSLVGLRSIFDQIIDDQHKYLATVLPMQGEGSDIFEKQRVALSQLQRSFYMAFGLTLPVAIIMWSGALMHTMVVPGLSVGALLTALLVTPVQFHSGSRFYKEAYRGLLVGTYGMGLLIALGTSFAYFFGVYSMIYSVATGGEVEAYPDHIMTAGMLITFMLLGKMMEIRAKLRTSSALKTLMDRQPKTAILLSSINGVESGEEDIDIDNEKESLMKEDELTEEREREIPVDLIQQGDVVKVIRGMSVPADGEVLFGCGEVNEALITGEALPVNKSVGSLVIGGTVLQDGMLHIVVKAAPENSMLQQIISLVEGAQMQKAPIQQIADAIAGVFTMIILTCASVVFLLWIIILKTNSANESFLPEGMSDFNIAFTLGVSTLVVACPCAMGLATPTAIMVGTGVGAKYGVLIKGGEALEKANKISTMVFDKTGTLTVGCPSVTCVYVLSQSGHPTIQEFDSATGNTAGRMLDVHADGSKSERVMDQSSPDLAEEFIDFDRLMWLTGCSEVSSEHVLGQAIVKHASSSPSSKVKPLREPEEMNAITGKGVECVVDGVKVQIGSLSYLQEENVKNSNNDDFIGLAEKIQSTGAIVIFVAVDDVMCSFMQLADSARPESEATVRALQEKGIDVWMVTGDNRRTAVSMGGIVGISEEFIIAGALPNTKIEHVKQLQKTQAVGFVGDGINDAPALAQADVGLAVGGGTDVAIESADMVLMRADLFSVYVAIDLSHSILRCIKRNLFWALAYNVCAIPIAAGVSLLIFQAIMPPWVAGGAMAMSSVSVVLSSLTLSFYTPPKCSVSSL